MAIKNNHRNKKKGRGSTIKLVVKSNDLVEARYMFDVWETRFFHSLIASIHKDDDDEKVYRLWFKDIKNNFKLKSNQSYEFLREAAISMAGKSVYIGWQNDKFRRGRMHRIIRFVDYLEKGQRGEGVEQQEYVDVSIDKDIKPYLLGIKKNFNPAISRYTSYDLRNIIKLKPYATRLYELFKQMEYKGFRTIIVEDLKDMFEITNEYPRFSNFYQKVILKSVKDINKNTDLTVPIENIEKVKKGRKVHALRFRIVSKSETEVSILRGEGPQISMFDEIESEVVQPLTPASEEKELFDEFREVVIQSFGVTASAFKKRLKTGKYSREAIEQAIAVTRRAKYKQEIKKTVSGFFISALEQGYTDVEIEQQKTKQRQAEAKKEANQLKAKLLLLQDEFASTINERIREVTSEDEAITQRAIDALSEHPLAKALIEAKEQQLERTLSTEDYRKDERLRTYVINRIVEQENEQFKDILNIYQTRIERLKLKIKGLKL
jgi:plasmid replication initiation protein/vacuolar-type H+-ATPase subunit F/Vma7